MEILMVFEVVFIYYLTMVRCEKNLLVRQTCQVQGHDYKICNTSSVLLSVELLTGRDQQSSFLSLSGMGISLIASDAFKNLPITNLQLDFGGKLELEKLALTGLPKLKILRFISGVLVLKMNMFIDVKSIRTLMMAIDQSDCELNEILGDLKNLEFLEIQNSWLREINEETFQNSGPLVSSLVLKQNNITKINSNTFLSLKNLKYLDLSSNNLGILQPGTFNHLENLESLSLSSNFLDIINGNVFNCLKKLAILELDNTKIMKIEKKAFAGLKLNWLGIKNAQLNSVDAGTFQDFTAGSLDISNNKITIISNGAFTNAKIRFIYLYNNFNTTVDKHGWGLEEKTKVYSVENFQKI